MSIHFENALGIHAQALSLRAERTRVLAANIANESTPGYLARDLDFTSLMQSGAAFSGVNSDTATASYRIPYHPSADGNTVEIGVEQAAFAQNATQFETSLTFVNMTLRGLARAIEGQ